MVFASAIFLFVFFPVVYIVYFLLKDTFKNFWLFLMSFVFYAWGGLSYALLVLLSTIVNYVVGLLMHNKEGRVRKIYLIIGVVYNLSILMFFKYFNFIVENIQGLARIGNLNWETQVPNIILPVGISFFTFQIMSYIIDLYRREIDVQRNIINLGLYILLFPQLIAGPIVRYIDVETQIREREIDLNSFVIGLQRFIVGLGKKVLIANAMGKWADMAFNDIGQLSTPMAWLGIIGYTIQIYFDFSAYSDMAIGIGKMFGFSFLENFNYPYIASTMQDFWRRWHISLTTWFRDYLYIPLGGNRKGKNRTYINSFIVFFCTGLWHGAAWNFVLWGLYHGLFLIIEKTKIGKIIQKMPRIIRHIYVIFIVILGWVMFRANSMSDALVFYKTMFIWNGDNIFTFFKALDNWNIIAFAMGLIFATPIMRTVKEKIESDKVEIVIFEYIIYFIIYVVSIMFVSGSSFNPFIYFRF
ncbi:MAG: MBOAT family O-acyltransferase [Filifactoraceae bacterium]